MIEMTHQSLPIRISSTADVDDASTTAEDGPCLDMQSALDIECQHIEESLQARRIHSLLMSILPDVWQSMRTSSAPARADFGEVAAAIRRSIRVAKTIIKGIDRWSWKVKKHQRVAIAFSGGGVRAASFASGLLWALAEKGVMKHVSHLSAVSGGTYASTAFASHILERGGPGPAENVDGWYREVMETFVLRMQRNIGYLVRSPNSYADFLKLPRDGSSRFPAAFDLPMLLLCLFGSILLSPIMLILYTVVPVSIFINMKTGLLLQAVFCDPDLLKENVFKSHTQIAKMIQSVVSYSLVLLGGLAFATIVVSVFLWYFRPLPSDPSPWTRTFLTCRAIRQTLVRAHVAIAIYLAALAIVALTQWYSWGQATLHPSLNVTQSKWIQQACYCYIWVRTHPDVPPPPLLAYDVGENGGVHGPPQLQCPSTNDMPWDQTTTTTTQHVHNSSRGPRARAMLAVPPLHFLQSRPLSEVVEEEDVSDHEAVVAADRYGADVEGGLRSVEVSDKSESVCEEKDYRSRLSVLFHSTYMNGTWVKENVLGRHFIPQMEEFRNTFPPFLLFNGILFLASLLALAWDTIFLRLVAMSLAPLWATYFTASFTRWVVFGPITTQYLLFGHIFEYTPENVTGIYIAACFAIVATLPFYQYVHSSLHLYYRHSLRRAYYASGRDVPLAEASRNYYCPALVLGACVNDYARPADNNFYDDFAFTPLFMGGCRTGFWPTLPHVQLSKAMSISGAAIDAAVLIQADKVSVRIWMSLLSLQMGDWLRVHDGTWRWLKLKPSWRQAVLAAVTAFFVGLFHVMLTTGFLSWKFVWSWPCHPEIYINTAAILAVVFGVITFFAFMPCLRWLMRSPVVLKWQMTLQHHFRGDLPPDYLYLSDGGLVECLGLLALLRRRERWMVVLDATSTKDDPTFCLRQTIMQSIQERIGSFYDPKHPTEALAFVFERFKHSNEPFLHLSVDYDPGIYGPRLQGQVFLVRMRVPSDDAVWQGGLISSQELGGVQPPPSDKLRRDLGGACCYEQCHMCGLSCGSYFPDIANANQFFTPRLFAELCRLGHELGGQAVDEMLRLWHDQA